jgi:ADP-ribose pyrophosphatase
MRFSCVDDRVLAQIGKFVFKTVTIQHERYDGTDTVAFSRCVFHRGDSVGILLYDRATDEIVITEQFRVGAAVNGDDPWLKEIVAGSMDVEGEAPEDVASREVEEEAPGCKINHIFHATSLYPSPGACTEKLHIFVADIDSSGAATHGGLQDHHEDIKVIKMPLKEAYLKLDRGELNTSSLIIGLYWMRQNLG